MSGIDDKLACSKKFSRRQLLCLSGRAVNQISGADFAALARLVRQ